MTESLGRGKGYESDTRMEKSQLTVVFATVRLPVPADLGRDGAVCGRAVTELGRAVRDSKYTTFGGLDSAHIAATEMLFREQIEEQVRLSHQLQCFNMTT